MKSNNNQPFFPESAKINETIADVVVNFSSDNCSWESFYPFFSWLNICPARDTFTLHLSIDGTPSTVYNTNTESESQLKQHFIDMEGSQYTANLTIEKTISNNTLSIYFLESFSDFIDTNKTTSTLQSLSKKFNEYIFFETFNSTITFGSETLFFSCTHPDVKNSDASTSRRLQQLQANKDNGITFDLPKEFIPEDFHILNKPETTPETLINFFNKVCTAYSICHIANSTSIDTSGRHITFSIAGYRTIEVILDLHSRDICLGNIYRIYEWIYSEGKSAEKLGLVRNIISLNTNTECSVLFDNCTWNAIKSNYQIYLKENIQQYLEVRSKISDAAIDASSKAADLCNNFLDGFKNNALGIASFLIGVVVVNGIKDNSPEKLFSAPYIAVAIFMLVTSACWLLVSRKDVIAKIDFISENIKHSLDDSYGSIIVESEINELIDPAIKRNKAFTSTQITRYTTFWIFTLLAFFLLFLIGGIYYETFPIKSTFYSLIHIIKCN